MKDSGRWNRLYLRINHYLGYDFNTVELALKDGVPYAIDFCNPAPDAEKTSVGEENFKWVVETAAIYAIEGHSIIKMVWTISPGENISREAGAETVDGINKL